LTGIVLVGILGLVAREYLSTPDILAQIDKQEENPEIVNSENTNSNNNETVKTSNEQTELSDDDKAIAADIDNVPSLLSDFAQATLSADLDISSEKNKPNKTNTEPFLEDIINNRNTANQNESKSTNLAVTNNAVVSRTHNPFLYQAQNLLQSHSNYISNQFLPENNSIQSPEKTTVNGTNSFLTNLNQETIKNQNQLIISPLEAAIQKNGNLNSMNPVLRNVSVSPIYSPNSLPNQYFPSNSSTGYVQPNIQPIMQNSSQPYYSNFNNNFNRVQTAPNVVTQPNSVYNAPPNYGYVQSTSQGTVKPTNPVGYQNYSGYNLQQSNLQQQNLQPSNLQPSNLQQPNLQPSNLQPSNLQQPNQLPPSNLSYPGQLQQYPNGTQR
jgi:hypothetical protein